MLKLIDKLVRAIAFDNPPEGFAYFAAGMLILVIFSSLPLLVFIAIKFPVFILVDTGIGILAGALYLSWRKYGTVSKDS